MHPSKRDSHPPSPLLSGAAILCGLLLFKHLTRGNLKSALRYFSPRHWKSVAKIFIRGTRYVPPAGFVAMGDLRRVTPLSPHFGYDRGRPLDRYYIEGFLARHAGDIRGRVLEIGDNDYTIQFGGARVTQSDVLHIHEGNPIATIIGDLTDAPHIESDGFDCIVLTQTLHMIYDLKSAIATLHRILKPGGVLLVTVPGISQIDHGEWSGTWLWSFTSRVIERLLGERFDSARMKVESHGNVLSSTAFLHGLAGSELTCKELNFNDPDFELLIAVRAVK